MLTKICCFPYNDLERDMQKFIINGGQKLYGKIRVDTSKNAILPILAGSIIIKGDVVLHNITYYEDVINMLQILNSLPNLL